MDKISSHLPHHDFRTARRSLLVASSILFFISRNTDIASAEFLKKYEALIDLESLRNLFQLIVIYLIFVFIGRIFIHSKPMKEMAADLVFSILPVIIISILSLTYSTSSL